MRSIELASATDFDGFRAAARGLILAEVPPESVTFRTGRETASLFADGDVQHGDVAPVANVAFKVPRAFVELARTVALHQDPSRFALLYRLLWRLREEPRLLAVDVDEDVAVARAWRKSVERDIHKMHAYVRFREVKGVEPRALIAWFEPTHHIVEEAAPFFVRRFPNVRWTILTPGVSAIWDTNELRFGPGGRRRDAPAHDAAEALWCEYYSSIFNPARLKVHSMQAHMPKKYWRNLPESAVIPALVRSAAARTESMLDSRGTDASKLHRGAAAVARHGVWRPREPEPLHDAKQLTSLPELTRRARHCRNCDLWRNATQTVFGEGPHDARLVLVGEQPGDQEDIAGTPFVGPAGRLLDRALRDAGIERRAVYVTNAVKHFKFEPRGKRRLHKTPSQQEALACHTWLERELELIGPQLIVALGATAARSLLERDLPIQRNRGRILEGVRVARAAVLVTVHPSYLLRVPDHQRDNEYAAFVADLVRAALFVQAEAKPPGQ